MVATKSQILDSMYNIYSDACHKGEAGVFIDHFVNF